MSICEDCICRKYCGDDDIRRCERYFRDNGIKKEQTNEEWFASIPTEEKAEFMGDIWGRGYLTSHFEGNFEFGEKQDKAYWEMWLKQPHTDK